MLFLCKPHQHSTYMRYAKIDTISWNKLIASPMVVEDKAKAPLSIWGRMKDVVEIDPVYRYPRCTGDNVGKLFALQVDIDNGCTMDEFVRCYHRYSFQLYSSFSYGFKDGDRFRAIFPLAEPIETKWLVPTVKTVLVNLFDMCDESCFDRAHWQIMPCIRSIDAPYKYIQHDGERLSFKYENFEQKATEYQDDAHWRKEIRKADYSTRPHDAALKKAQQILDDAVEGARNRTMYSVLRWLKDKVQIEESEAYELTPPADMDTEFVQMIVRLWK